MSDENKSQPPVTPAPAAKSGNKRFTYTGKAPKNANRALLVGHEKIKPWEMTDDQIEAFLSRHPGQDVLWKDADKK